MLYLASWTCDRMDSTSFSIFGGQEGLKGGLYILLRFMLYPDLNMRFVLFSSSTCKSKRENHILYLFTTTKVL